MLESPKKRFNVLLYSAMLFEIKASNKSKKRTFGTLITLLTVWSLVVVMYLILAWCFTYDKGGIEINGFLSFSHSHAFCRQFVLFLLLVLRYPLGYPRESGDLDSRLHGNDMGEHGDNDSAVLSPRRRLI